MMIFSLKYFIQQFYCEPRKLRNLWEEVCCGVTSEISIEIEEF